MLLAVLFATGLEAGLVPERPRPINNGEQLNVACDPAYPQGLDALECYSTAVVALSEFSHYGRGSNETGGNTMFCLSKSSPVSVENLRPLADAYRRQYARDPKAYAAVTPIAAFVRAMRREWPCAGGR